MPEHTLNEDERKMLLYIARQALEAGVRKVAIPVLELDKLPLALRENGVTFVTLTKQGALRGCVGALEPYQSLAEDVQEHAVAAALHDFRFRPVQHAELAEIEIEVSRLTSATRLDYTNPQDLLQHLRPGIDGVILRDGFKRATFLPQVWEKLPDAEQFLEHLCMKMGSPADLWRHKKLDVMVYQVEEFQE